MNKLPAARIRATTVINLALLFAFAALFLARRNYEFIVYVLSLGSRSPLLRRPIVSSVTRRWHGLVLPSGCSFTW